MTIININGVVVYSRKMMKVLYEDSDCLVINKPAGVVVNRADSVDGVTVQDWMEKEHPECFEGVEDKVYMQRSGLCHRLDKETSGCLLVAKSPKTLKYFLKLFKDRRIKKTYIALVHGKVEPDHGEMILPLRRSRVDREKWQVHYDGKRAVTEWTVMSRYVYPDTPHFGNSVCLLEIYLKTGRTHQIRVHMSFLGWPLFADERYLNRGIVGLDRKMLSHHFLHAGRLEFVNMDGNKIVVESPLDNEYMKVLDSLMLE